MRRRSKSKFAALTMVANELLNLDEVLVKWNLSKKLCSQKRGASSFAAVRPGWVLSRWPL
jgi:hypothetical protein